MVRIDNVNIGLSAKLKNMQPESTRDRFNPKGNLLFVQFRSEKETWGRTLDSLIEEDVNLKMRLSEILKNMNQRDDELLERIEHFHNRLLSVIETIGFLRLEVTKIEKELYQVYSLNIGNLSELWQKQMKLRKEMERAEYDFHVLKFNLNNFIADVLKT